MKNLKPRLRRKNFGPISLLAVTSLIVAAFFACRPARAQDGGMDANLPAEDFNTWANQNATAYEAFSDPGWTPAPQPADLPTKDAAAIEPIATNFVQDVAPANIAETSGSILSSVGDALVSVGKLVYDPEGGSLVNNAATRYAASYVYDTDGASLFNNRVTKYLFVNPTIGAENYVPDCPSRFHQVMEATVGRLLPSPIDPFELNREEIEAYKEAYGAEKLPALLRPGFSSEEGLCVIPGFGGRDYGWTPSGWLFNDLLHKDANVRVWQQVKEKVFGPLKGRPAAYDRMVIDVSRGEDTALAGPVRIDGIEYNTHRQIHDLLLENRVYSLHDSSYTEHRLGGASVNNGERLARFTSLESPPRFEGVYEFNAAQNTLSYSGDTWKDFRIEGVNLNTPVSFIANGDGDARGTVYLPTQIIDGLTAPLLTPDAVVDINGEIIIRGPQYKAKGVLLTSRGSEKITTDLKQGGWLVDIRNPARDAVVPWVGADNAQAFLVFPGKKVEMASDASGGEPRIFGVDAKYSVEPSGKAAGRLRFALIGVDLSVLNTRGQDVGLKDVNFMPGAEAKFTDTKYKYPLHQKYSVSGYGVKFEMATRANPLGMSPLGKMEITEKAEKYSFSEPVKGQETYVYDNWQPDKPLTMVQVISSGIGKDADKMVRKEGAKIAEEIGSRKGFFLEAGIHNALKDPASGISAATGIADRGKEFFPRFVFSAKEGLHISHEVELDKNIAVKREEIKADGRVVGVLSMAILLQGPRVAWYSPDTGVDMVYSQGKREFSYDTDSGLLIFRSLSMKEGLSAEDVRGLYLPTIGAQPGREAEVTIKSNGLGKGDYESAYALNTETDNIFDRGGRLIADYSGKKGVRLFGKYTQRNDISMFDTQINAGAYGLSALVPVVKAGEYTSVFSVKDKSFLIADKNNMPVAVFHPAPRLKAEDQEPGFLKGVRDRFPGIRDVQQQISYDAPVFKKYARVTEGQLDIYTGDGAVSEKKYLKAREIFDVGLRKLDHEASELHKFREAVTPESFLFGARVLLGTLQGTLKIEAGAGPLGAILHDREHKEKSVVGGDVVYPADSQEALGWRLAKAMFADYLNLDAELYYQDLQDKARKIPYVGKAAKDGVNLAHVYGPAWPKFIADTISDPAEVFKGIRNYLDVKGNPDSIVHQFLRDPDGTLVNFAGMAKSPLKPGFVGYKAGAADAVGALNRIRAFAIKSGIQTAGMMVVFGAPQLLGYLSDQAGAPDWTRPYQGAVGFGLGAGIVRASAGAVGAKDLGAKEAAKNAGAGFRDGFLGGSTLGLYDILKSSYTEGRAGWQEVQDLFRLAEEFGKMSRPQEGPKQLAAVNPVNPEQEIGFPDAKKSAREFVEAAGRGDIASAMKAKAGYLREATNAFALDPDNLKRQKMAIEATKQFIRERLGTDEEIRDMTPEEAVRRLGFTIINNPKYNWSGLYISPEKAHFWKAVSEISGGKPLSEDPKVLSALKPELNGGMYYNSAQGFKKGGIFHEVGEFFCDLYGLDNKYLNLGDEWCHTSVAVLRLELELTRKYCSPEEYGLARFTITSQAWALRGVIENGGYPGGRRLNNLEIEQVKSLVRDLENLLIEFYSEDAALMSKLPLGTPLNPMGSRSRSQSERCPREID